MCTRSWRVDLGNVDPMRIESERKVDGRSLYGVPVRKHVKKSHGGTTSSIQAIGNDANLVDTRPPIKKASVTVG